MKEINIKRGVYFIRAVLMMLLMAVLVTCAACGSSSDYTTAATNGDLSALGDIHLCVREDGVDVIVVDSILCSDESIEAMEYPFSRYFYLSWIGDESDLMSDFLSYLNSAGQEIVSENYVSVKKASTFLADQTIRKNGGTITVAGSSSVAPLMAELAEGYLSCYSDGGGNADDEDSEITAGITVITSGDGLTVTCSAGNITIAITTSDSGSGITDMLLGKYDFAMSSREFEDYEAQLVTCQAIAKDGIAIIVQAGSPVKNLETEQLADIFGRAVTSWQ